MMVVHKTIYKYVTCLCHIFTNFESTNAHFFFAKNVLFPFEGAAKIIVKINSFSNSFISIEKFYLVLKENKHNFVKEIRGFVDSEFVKTCHEHVNRSSKYVLHHRIAAST